MNPIRIVLALMLCFSIAAPTGARQERSVTATRLSAGAFHTCVIEVESRTICWGDNRAGQSGGGIARETVLANTVPGPQLVEIAAGGRHTCGLDRLGQAWCWGDNTFGQLGNGAKTKRYEPTAVKGGLRFVAITAGESHTCALTSTGPAWCWGDQWDRAAGAFRAGDNLTEPFPVKGGLFFDQLAAGGRHTCGVTRDREVWCWGNNTHKQVATAGWDVVDYPLHMVDLPPVRTVRVGAFYSCALAVAGSIHCWGSLNADSTSIRSVQIPTREFNQIATGLRHMCARTTDEVTFCWGDNASRQIWADPTDWIVNPSPIPALQTFRSLSAGSNHTCGLDRQGRVYCWGDNTYGQLGDTGLGLPTPRLVRQGG